MRQRRETREYYLPTDEQPFDPNKTQTIPTEVLVALLERSAEVDEHDAVTQTARSMS